MPMFISRIPLGLLSKDTLAAMEADFVQAIMDGFHEPANETEARIALRGVQHEQTRKTEAGGEPAFWLSPVHDFDDFAEPITNEIIDGRTKEGGQWALMSADSWARHGCGRLGTGFGQRYRLQPEGAKFAGKWLKVEG